MDERERERYVALQRVAIEGVSGLRPPLTEIQDAVVAPPAVWRDRRGEVDLTPARPRLDGGVWDARGGVGSSAHLETGVELLAPDGAEPPATAELLRGRWLYLGLVVDSFGHCLLDSLGRVWAMDDPTIGAIDGVILLFEPGAEATLSASTAALLALAIDRPVHRLRRTTRVERLIVPRQESSAGFGMFGTARQTAAMRRRFRPGPTGDDELLFVSRAGLTAYPTGRIIGGTAIEACMAASGVRVIRPETMPVADQLRAYRGARLIILEEGSAGHLVAVSGAEDLTVVLLARRPWMTMLFEAHLALSLGPGARIETIDRPGPIVQLPGIINGAWQLADPPALQARLAELDPAFTGVRWPVADPALIADDARVIETALGARFVPLDPRTAARA